MTLRLVGRPSCASANIKLMERGIDSRVHRRTEHELLVERGPVLIRVLAGVATEIEDTVRACELLDDMLTRYSAVASLAIVEHGTPIPSLAVRRFTAERFASYGPRLVSGVAFMGMGFWAKADAAELVESCEGLRGQLRAASVSRRSG